MDAFLLRIKRKNILLLLIVKRRTTTVSRGADKPPIIYVQIRRLSPEHQPPLKRIPYLKEPVRSLP
jgi:hypothetical protein